jgi:Sigma-70, region 4
MTRPPIGNQGGPDDLVPLRFTPPQATWRNPGQREALAAGMRSRGQRVDVIAAALGVPRKTVLRDLARWRKRQRRLRDAVTLRAEGLSLREVARRLGVTEATVRADVAKWTHARIAAESLRDPGPGVRTEIDPLDFALWEASLSHEI